MAFYFSLTVKEGILVNEKSVVKEKNFSLVFRVFLKKHRFFLVFNVDNFCGYLLPVVD